MRTYETTATPRGPVTIIHDAQPVDIDAHGISPGLCSITRNPDVKRRVLKRLATDPEARLTLATVDGVIVGCAMVAKSFGRWQQLPHAREFAIEVAREWRHGAHLAERLVRTAVTDPGAEQEILLAFGLPSSWDTEYEQVPVMVYQRALALVLGGHGFHRKETDEPEIVSQRGAALFTRIGASVPAESIAAYERACFARPRPAA